MAIGMSALLGERLQRRLATAEDHAVSSEDQRPLGRVDQRSGPRHDRRTRLAANDASGAAASQSNSHDACCASLVMSINTGPGRPVAAIEKGLAHGRRDVLRARDQVVVLRDRQRDAGDVGFLKRVASR